MQYNLKDKIEVTTEFLNELITKSWQEVDAIQQQITNIDSTSQLGADVSKLLKNVCTSYYTLIGCLEDALEEPSTIEHNTNADNTERNAHQLHRVQLFTKQYNAKKCAQNDNATVKAREKDCAYQFSRKVDIQPIVGATQHARGQCCYHKRFEAIPYKRR